MKTIADIRPEVLAEFRRGTVIPAQPLALDADRKFAPKYQRALCRYYLDAGVGGIAVGVHSTQFAIRKKEIGLFEPVLRMTSGFIDEWSSRTGRKIQPAKTAVNGATSTSEKLPISVLTTSEATSGLFRKSSTSVPCDANIISNVIYPPE